MPLVLLVSVSIFEFGRAYQTWQVLTNAAREGARVAILPDSTDAQVTDAVRSLHAGRQAAQLRARRTSPSSARCRSGPTPHRGSPSAIRFNFTVLNPVMRLVKSSSTTGKGTTKMVSSALMRNEKHTLRGSESTMRNRIFAVLAIAILAGGGLAYGTYNFMQAARVEGGRRGDAAGRRRRRRSAARHRAQEGRPRRSSSSREGAAPEGSFSQPDELLGRGLIVPIVKNEPILAAKLASKEAGAGLPPVIPEGMRAVSVRVNEVVGVAGYVLPGNRVDVVATASPTESRADTTSKVVLSNVQVLTAGTRMEQDQDENKPMQVTVVTLLVNPEQAERLALASTEGKIQLALRNPLDTRARPRRPASAPAGLLGGKPAPAAPRDAVVALEPQLASQAAGRRRAGHAGAPSVEIIRGDKRSTEVIK